MKVLEELMGFEQIRYMFSGWIWKVVTFFLFNELMRTGQVSLSIMQPLFKLGLLDLAVEGPAGDYEVELLHIYLASSKDASLVRTLNDKYPLHTIRPSVRGHHLRFYWDKDMGVDALRTMVRLEGALTADDLQEWDADGAPLCHILFHCLGGSMYGEILPLGEMMAWRSLIRELVTVGADLHGRRALKLYWHRALTPFLYAVREMILNVVWCQSLHPRLRPCRLGLRRIVEMLHGCGLDLDAFGAMEGFGGRGNHGLSIRFENSRQAMRLERIHYGPDVEDWRLEWGFKLSNEDLVGEFWQMVETPSQSMPGAWPESDSYSDTDSDTDSYVDWDDEIYRYANRRHQEQ